MHSGYEIPGIQQHPQSATDNDNPVLLSTHHPTHFPNQFHAGAHHRLFLDPPHFLPPQTHHYLGRDSSSSPYFPAVNFKLGLNEVCSTNNINEYNSEKESSIVNIEEGGGDCSMLHESERFEVPEEEAPQSSPILHCWANQQDSTTIKQQPISFWEHLESNENAENMAHKPEHGLTDFGELEAIYKPVGQTGTCEDGSAAGQPPEEKRKRRKKEKMKKNDGGGGGGVIGMAEFFGDLVRRVVEHQESMHQKLAEVLGRLEEERAAREEEWRRREAARLVLESEAGARERALARGREAVIVSYLERITGGRVCSVSEEVGDGSGSNECSRDHAM
ncbi:Trihelix transcription factor PTL [Striga hermonthica]|uniref:Trihelix transcription factor PTL n=1 Tax=Striga hermonthica TaxID=68872 RepID=A0A9N7NLC9_STRHE|nr:Trihelix transcription factor PTL [Striga hermonthica]